ncbi:hypothetical protein E4U21_004320 [Claviceps maximensis]|nr:hypothetical protein E4U21_004320 [Claviceps maximensis]
MAAVAIFAGQTLAQGPSCTPGLPPWAVQGGGDCPGAAGTWNCAKGTVVGNARGSNKYSIHAPDTPVYIVATCGSGGASWRGVCDASAWGSFTLNCDGAVSILEATEAKRA